MKTTARSCKNIERFFQSTVPDEACATAPNNAFYTTLPEAVSAPVGPEILFLFYENFYFGMLDPYDIFEDEEVNVEEVKPLKYTMETALDNLMKVEANIIRNKKVEKKVFYKLIRESSSSQLFSTCY